MNFKWKKLVWLLALIPVLLTACNKDMSDDTPLSDTVTPTLVIGCENKFVYGYDPVTGRKKWEYLVNDDVQASPITVNGNLFIFTLSGYIYKFNHNTGKLIARYHLGNSSGYIGTPLANGKYIYAPSINSRLYCVNSDDGTVVWSATADAAITSSPILREGFVVFGGNDGKVYCVDAETGWNRWTFNTGNIANAFSSSPTLKDNIVYIGCTNNYLYAINFNDGTEAWKYPTGGPVTSSPVVYGNNVLVGSQDNKFYCFDIVSKSPRWTVEATDRFISTPFVRDQVIYVGNYDYNLYAINILDGNIKWKYKTNSLIFSSPLLKDNVLYFGSYDRFLYALQAPTGAVKWKINVNGTMRCSPLIVDENGTSYHSNISGAGSK